MCFVIFAVCYLLLIVCLWFFVVGSFVICCLFFFCLLLIHFLFVVGSFFLCCCLGVIVSHDRVGGVALCLLVCLSCVVADGYLDGTMLLSLAAVC